MIFQPTIFGNVTAHDYVSSIDFTAQQNYRKLDIGENFGVLTFGTKTNFATYKVKINSGAWQTNPATITVTPNDVVEIYVTKTTIGQTASVSVSGKFSLNNPIATTYATTTVEYVDDWMLQMLNHYQEINTNQLDTPDMVEEFLNRLQPHYIRKNSDGSTYDIGYAYNTYGPSGRNEQQAYWIIFLRVIGSIQSFGSNYFGFRRYVALDLDGYYYPYISSLSLIVGDALANKIFYISLYYNPDILTGFDKWDVCWVANQSCYCKFPHQGVDNRVVYLNNSGGFYGELPVRILGTVSSQIISRTQLTGILKLANPVTGGTSLNFTYNNFTGVLDEVISYLPNLTLISFIGNNFNDSAIDNLLKNVYLDRISKTPTANLTISLTGAFMGKPTSVGLNYITLITNHYTSNSRTFTCNLNA